MSEAIPMGPRTDIVTPTPDASSSAPKVDAATNTPATQSQNETKPTNLADVLKMARETGEKRRSGSENSTWAKAKELAKAAWNNTAEGMKQMKKDYTLITDVAAGLANPDVRAALGTYMQEKASDAQDALIQKGREIKDAAVNKKDDMIAGFQDRVRGLWKKANESLIQPQVAKAREIASTTRKVWGETKTVGGEIVDFFQQQAENTANGIRARGAEVNATWHDILAKPREIRATVVGGFAEKLNNYAKSSSETAQNHRTRAAEMRVKSTTLRTGGLAAA